MRIVELFKRMAEVQKADGVVALIDETAQLSGMYVREYAAQTGVRVEGLLISNPDDGEQAEEIAHSLRRSGTVDLIARVSFGFKPPRNLTRIVEVWERAKLVD